MRVDARTAESLLAVAEEVSPAITGPAGKASLERLEALLLPPDPATAFGTQYLRLLQHAPGVAVAHASASSGSSIVTRTVVSSRRSSASRARSTGMTANVIRG